ncbi:MAG: hypothetical protein J6Q17_03405 [Clostridia bacterium]|nr:hypothetical protein [Clostridia bacterium]
MNEFDFLTVQSDGGRLALRRRSSQDLAAEYAPAVIGTAAGNPAVFRDGAAERKIREAKVRIEPVQIGSGDPAPDNVRPITGRTGAILSSQFGNIFTTEGAQAGYAIDVSGEICETQGYAVTDYIDIAGMQTLMFRYYRGPEPWITPHIRVNLYGAGKSLIGQASFDTLREDEWLIRQFDTDGAAFLRMSVPASFGADMFTLAAVGTVSASFPSGAGTVYGGIFDAAAGTLTVTMAEIDPGSIQWTRSSVSGRWVFISPDIAGKALNFNFLCSSYPNLRTYGDQLTDKTCGLYDTATNRFCIRDDSYADAAAFKAAMSGVQIVYELAQPLTYTLAPAQLRTMQGENAFWTDCEAVEIEYVRDTGTVIENGDAALRALVAREEAGFTATKNYSAGAFLTTGGKLYRVTANIAAGGEIEPGTNVTATTVGEQLALLWAAVNS